MNKVLLETIDYVVENFLFLLSDGIPGEYNSSDEYYKTTIKFIGNKKGKMIVIASKSLLISANESLLDNEIDDESLIIDMANELTNNICGNFLRSYFDNEIFDLTPPKTQKIDKFNVDEYSSRSIEGNPIFVKIDME